MAQRQSLRSCPPHAELAAEGAFLPLTGSIELMPEIYNRTYPGLFLVSPNLSSDLVLGRPWLWAHNVIHEHRGDCIYIGEPERQRIFLNPTNPRKSDNILTPELTHAFPSHFKEQFDEIVRRHHTIFHQGGRLQQTIAAVQHEIHVSDTRSFRDPPRRYSEEKRAWIDSQVRDMLADGVIEPVTSPYSSAIVVAGKKDGDYRFCIDYRRLNDITIDAPQCLPRINEILKDLGNAKIFSSVDFKSGYWQIPLAHDSRRYTAFTTPSGGQFQFRVMPFGLKNAPGTFQNFMRHVLAEFWGKFAIAYLDDIIVFSDTWDNHLLHLALLFERLQIYGLTCSSSKCNFGQTNLPYMGHMVNWDTNSPQEGHLDAVTKAEPPKTRKHLQSLIGTLNWLNEYVPNFAELVSPMTDLLSPRRPFRWTKEAQESLEKVKEQFKNPVPLSRPDPDLPFILQTDASAKGMGAVLMQQTPEGERKIVSFASAKFSETESRYHCNEQECLAIIWAIRRYRPYLEDRRFVLRTDSKTLTWLRSQKDTRAKLTRWHLLLSEFNFDIEHCPGKDNELPDALSRYPNPNELSPGEPNLDRMVLPTYQTPKIDETELTPVIHNIHVPSLFREIAMAQQGDEAINNEVGRWLQLLDTPNLSPHEEEFVQKHQLDENGFWKRSTDDDKWLFLVPPHLRQSVIWEYHDKPLAGHPGAEETIRAIQSHFTWPGMVREIRRYVTGCHLCICCKPVRGHRQDNLRPRSAKTAWDTIAVDLMGPYPRTNKGHRFILVITDLFTRWIEAFPLRDATAPRIVQVLENEVFSRWGFPRRILSDNGTQFTGVVWAQASDKWDCQLWTTPTYHPRANPTERRNQEIKKGLRLRLYRGNQRTWDTQLPELLFGLRRRRNAATGNSPSYQLLGRDLKLPGEWRLPHPDQPQEEVETDTALRQRELQARIRQRNYQTRYGGIENPKTHYVPGEFVYTRNHKLSNKATGYNAGLAPPWIGPYEVLENLSGEVYWIQKEDGPHKIHGNQLRQAPEVNYLLEIGEQPSHSHSQIVATPPAYSVPIPGSNGRCLSTMTTDVSVGQLEIGEQPSHSHSQIVATPPAHSVPIPGSNGRCLSTMTTDVSVGQPEIGEQPSHSHSQVVAAPPAHSVPIPGSNGRCLRTMTTDVSVSQPEIGEQLSHSHSQIDAAPLAHSVPILGSNGRCLRTMTTDVLVSQSEIGEQPSHSHSQIIAASPVHSVPLPGSNGRCLRTMITDISVDQSEVGEQISHPPHGDSSGEESLESRITSRRFGLRKLVRKTYRDARPYAPRPRR